MVLGVKNDMNSEMEIHIDEQFANLEPVPMTSPFSISSDLESFLIDQSINMQIDNAFDTPLKQAEIPDTTSFYGIPDASYLLDDYTRFPVMEEVMREYVYGVNVRRENGKFVFKVLNIPRNEIMNDGPLVLLDGVPVYDIDELMGIDPLKLRKIDVVHRKYFYGSLDCNGILAFYSYNSDLADLELSQETIQRNYQGFQESRTFYSPKYNTKEALESRLPDYRNQLYWAPKIVTNADGTVNIKFFTSDTTGTYFIQIHGLGSNGLAGSFSGKIEVTPR